MHVEGACSRLHGFEHKRRFVVAVRPGQGKPLPVLANRQRAVPEWTLPEHRGDTQTLIVCIAAVFQDVRVMKPRCLAWQVG